MNIRLLLIAIFLLATYPVATQESAPLGEPSASGSAPSPIQSPDFAMIDPQRFRDDTLGDERINDNDSKPLTFVISGKAKVVDGDTITINRTKIRFSGIDAPESYYYGQTQYCQRPNGKIWACGKKATSKLKELINGQTVQCTDEGKDKYDRTLSICFANGVDLQSEMVRSGMAVAYLKYSRRYENEMVEAMTQRAGMWSGNFLDPEDWRRENSVRD
tara:strand:- start:101 stop:751 length:651 start_codon:yes stop_codon:yes gene_type:complete